MRLWPRVAASLGLTAIVACATSATTYGPDGRVAHAIQCSGAVLTWGDCFRKAGEICKEAGYDVVSGNGESGTVVSATAYGAFAAPPMNRSLVVSCKRT